jgi:NADH dehydrogenase
LILATGTITNYFGNKSIQENALPMKTISDAIDLKNKILERLEKASKISDEELRAKLTTFVIAGGGPTGVEVAGMLSELRKDILFKDYPELKNAAFNIYLIDGLPNILAPMSKESQQYARKTLEGSGIIVKLGQVVKDYIDGVVHLADGTSIPSENLIWTAGVTAQKFNGIPEESYGKRKPPDCKLF